MNSQQQRESLAARSRSDDALRADGVLTRRAYQRVIRRLIEVAFVCHPEWQHREFYAIGPC